jgi:hypothetical protein
VRHTGVTHEVRSADRNVITGVTLVSMRHDDADITEISEIE